MEAMSRSIDAKTVSHFFLVDNLTGDISWAGEVHNDSLSFAIFTWWYYWL